MLFFLKKKVESHENRLSSTYRLHSACSTLPCALREAGSTAFAWMNRGIFRTNSSYRSKYTLMTVIRCHLRECIWRMVDCPFEKRKGLPNNEQINYNYNTKTGTRKSLLKVGRDPSLSSRVQRTTWLPQQVETFGFVSPPQPLLWTIKRGRAAIRLHSVGTRGQIKTFGICSFPFLGCFTPSTTLPPNKHSKRST